MLIKLYHYSNSLYQRLKNVKRNKEGIWFTTSADGYNGQQWLFRYEIIIEESDNNLIMRHESDDDIHSIKWYTYDANELNYDKVECLNPQFKPLVKPICEFREMIENTDFTIIPEAKRFCGFPKGCCGDTTSLLWKYLQEKLYGKYDNDIWMVSGTDNGTQTHAWLEYMGMIIIDITADQFEDVYEPVIITMNKEYYRKFRRPKGKMSDEVDFINYREEIKEKLQKIYNMICKNSSLCQETGAKYNLAKLNA